MAANIGARVIARIIRDGDIQPALDSHLDESWFRDEDDARVWRYLQQHYVKHGEVASTVLVKASFPSYRVLDPSDGLEPLLEEFRRKRKSLLTTTMVMDAVEQIEEHKDHDAALAVLTKGIAEVEAETSATSDSDFVEGWEARLDYYEELKHKNGMLGLPTGFPSIDEATAGLQPEQLICVVAIPKGGKSTLMLKIALHITEQGHMPLFLSFEMSSREQSSRFDAFRAGVDHKRLTTGQLTKEDWRKLERAGELAEKRGWSFMHSEDIAASTTVSAIAGRIEAVKPDVCFIDGVYLMHDELGEDPGSPQALTNITRNLKRLAQRTKIPIVMSTQALPSKVKRRTGVSTDSIGYSSSFFQDSDTLFGLDRGEDDDERLLRILDARNTGRKEVRLTWDWTTSTFEEREPYNVGAYEDDEDDD